MVSTSRAVNSVGRARSITNSTGRCRRRSPTVEPAFTPEAKAVIMEATRGAKTWNCSSAAWRSPARRKRRSTGNVLRPNNSDSVPEAARFDSSICNVRSWPWQKPKPKKTSSSSSASIIGMPWRSRRNAIGPRGPSISSAPLVTGRREPSSNRNKARLKADIQDVLLSFNERQHPKCFQATSVSDKRKSRLDFRGCELQGGRPQP